MSRRILAIVAGAACGLTTSTLVACASDENAVLATPDGGENRLPGADGGGDALPEDADAAVAAPCPPDALCPNGPFDPDMPGGPLDVRTRINVIRGRSANDVWAAGAKGTMAHFDGTSWTRSETGTLETMRAVWLRTDGEIALSSLASIYSRGLAPQGGNGDASAPSTGGWTATTLARASGFVTSSWATPGAEWLWLTTHEDGLWRLRIDPVDNSLEIRDALPPNACLTFPCRYVASIHGISADDLWVVGHTGTTFHITNAQSATPGIAQLDSQTWAALNGVWVASENDVWAVGGAGVIRHYTGQPSWDVVSDVPTSNDLYAVWGSSATDVWAVGEGAIVLHYDGKAWATVEVAGLGDRRPDLYTVWTSAPGHVWVGGDGVILSLGGKP